LIDLLSAQTEGAVMRMINLHGNYFTKEYSAMSH
jgi:hypothetical protein